VPEPGEALPLDQALQSLAQETFRAVDQAVRSLHLNTAPTELWKLVRAVNKYIDDAQPWTLAKEGNRVRLNTVMYHVFEALRIEAILLAPFLPTTGQRFWEQLGQEGAVADQGLAAARWGGTRPGTVVKGGDPLFPRLDVEKVLDELAARQEAQVAGRTEAAPQPGTGQSGHGADAGKSQGPAQGETAGKSNETTDKGAETVDLITIDEFAKVKLRLAKVLQADRVQGADRLLKLQIDLGDEKRQIVAGIAKHYTPEQLVGKTIVVVANLQPAKLRGEVSQGMLLAASDESGRLSLLTVEDDLAPGSVVR